MRSRTLPLVLTFVFTVVSALSSSCRAQVWVPQSSGTTDTLYGVHFVSALEGWAVGGTLNTSSVILHTTDGGKSWVRQAITSTDRLRGVHFPDRLHGYAVGDFGLFAYTDTGGQEWHFRRVSDSDGNRVSLYSIKMLDASTGWVSAADGNVYKAAYGGATFDQQYTGNTALQLSVDFADADTGVVVGNFGRMYYTDSGGDYWETVSPAPVSKHLRCVDLVNAQTGFAVGDAGTILRTSNGGAAWSALASGTTTNLNGLTMANAQTGVAVGNGGLILSTTNAGGTWTPSTSNTTSTLRSVHGVDATHVFAVGDNGVILALSGSSGGTLGDTDTDGDLDMDDVCLTLRIACGGHKPTSGNIAGGDLDGDTRLTRLDALRAIRLINHLQ